MGGSRWSSERLGADHQPCGGTRADNTQDALMEMPVNSRIMTRSKSGDAVERLGSSDLATLVTSSRVPSGANQASGKVGALWVVSSPSDWLAWPSEDSETLTPASCVSAGMCCTVRGTPAQRRPQGKTLVCGHPTGAGESPEE